MGFFFSGCFPLSSISCVSGPPSLPVTCLPSIAPVLPPSSSFPSFLPSFPPYHLPPFSCLSSRSSCFFLGSSGRLLSSNRPPLPPVTLVSFYCFFAVFCRFFFPCLSSPPVSLLPSPPVCVLPSLPSIIFPVVSSCHFFLTIASWVTPAVVTCAFLSVVSFTTLWCLP